MRCGGEGRLRRGFVYDIGVGIGIWVELVMLGFAWDDIRRFKSSFSGLLHLQDWTLSDADRKFDEANVHERCILGRFLFPFRSWLICKLTESRVSFLTSPSLSSSPSSFPLAYPSNNPHSTTLKLPNTLSLTAQLSLISLVSSPSFAASYSPL